MHTDTADLCDSNDNDNDYDCDYDYDYDREDEDPASREIRRETEAARESKRRD